MEKNNEEDAVTQSEQKFPLTSWDPKPLLSQEHRALLEILLLWSPAPPDTGLCKSSPKVIHGQLYLCNKVHMWRRKRLTFFQKIFEIIPMKVKSTRTYNIYFKIGSWAEIHLTLVSKRNGQRFQMQQQRKHYLPSLFGTVVDCLSRDPLVHKNRGSWGICGCKITICITLWKKDPQI